MESHLIERWSENHEILSVVDRASVSQARDQVKQAGRRVGLSEQRINEFLIVVSELAQNQLRHAMTGEMIIHEILQFGIPGLEIIALDHGSGIPDPEAAFSGLTQADEVSLKGGLAAVYRLSDMIDIDTRMGEGTCIWAKKFVSTPPLGCEAAIMGRPYPGEMRSGDDGTFSWNQEKLVIGVADGFGHGALARRSSETAIGCIRELYEQGLSRVLDILNEKLSAMRGTMLTLGEVDFQKRNLEVACFGDVSATLFHRTESFHATCHSGVIPEETNVRPFQYRFDQSRMEPGDLLVMYTDGLQDVTGKVLNDFDLRRRPAIVIAQHLLENHSRETDDALILVVRFAAKGAV